MHTFFSVACVVGSCHRTTEDRFPRPPTAVV